MQYKHFLKRVSELNCPFRLLCSSFFLSALLPHGGILFAYHFHSILVHGYRGNASDLDDYSPTLSAGPILGRTVLGYGGKENYRRHSLSVTSFSATHRYMIENIPAERMIHDITLVQDKLNYIIADWNSFFYFAGRAV